MSWRGVRIQTGLAVVNMFDGPVLVQHGIPMPHESQPWPVSPSRSRKARKGRNPKTGAAIEIAATVTPGFSAGKQFKDAVKAAHT